MKNYQKPDVIYISLETEEAITADMGASMIPDDKYDEIED